VKFSEGLELVKDHNYSWQQQKSSSSYKSYLLPDIKSFQHMEKTGAFHKLVIRFSALAK